MPCSVPRAVESVCCRLRNAVSQGVKIALEYNRPSYNRNYLLCVYNPPIPVLALPRMDLSFSNRRNVSAVEVSDK